MTSSSSTAVSGPKQELAPLTGCTIGVTAARRAGELGSLLERNGGRVVYGTALRILPMADDTELRRVTEACLDRPPDVAVATTGVGFRGWVEAAESWGMGAELLESLRGARVLARGPKARGAVRTAGLPDAWSPDSESSGELLEHLLGESLLGVRVAVQLHGQPLSDFVETLRCAGAEVIEVPVYRWTTPADPVPLENLLQSVCAREVDAVTFTSAPAAASMLAVATRLGVRDDLLSALNGPVLAACVGPVSAGPLSELDVPVIFPARFRVGALVRTLCEVLPQRSPRLPVAGHELQLRGNAAVVDGIPKPLSPNARALLRALAEHPGHVVPRSALAAAVNSTSEPGRPVDEHAVEQAIARLRAALGAPELVQTVIKRGYRLPLEPMKDSPRCAVP
ncbi:uroporphyrinogen-III synthase [Parasphingorhabdus pacifica]